MNILWRQSRKDPLRTGLNSVSNRLAKLYSREAKQLIRSPETMAETEALYVVLRFLTQVQTDISRTVVSQQGLKPETVISFLANQRGRLQEAIREKQLASYVRASELSVFTMNLLFLAENEISNRFGIEPVDSKRSIIPTDKNRVSISSDLLYQMYHNLFPAEKMLVGSGKRNGGTVEIEAVFDVTGKNSSGHVHAEPERLGRALIAMEHTKSHFAIWVHSHPGTGKEMTRPSDTDINQHNDWLRHYSPNLVSGIMVADRWIRFWGTAIRQGDVEVEIIGAGVNTEERNESIYRLDQ